jgi:hypothetical protein
MSIASNKNQNLGSEKAEIVLYLPSSPIINPLMDKQKPDIKQIIEDNGNHWRKILTIFAKLTCVNSQWRNYRDKQLLQCRELICFDDSLIVAKGWHIVAGKASWARLGIDQQQFEPIDEQGRAWHKGNVLLTPYFDYRQFPNQLIKEVLSQLEN